MNVLLAVDGSEFSEAAVRAVIAQFAPASTKVRVIHAADWEQRLPMSYRFAEGPEATAAALALRDRTLAEAQEYADRTATQLRSAGFEVTADVRREGDAREVILDAAEQWPADLIVIGSHGRTGLQRFFLGSVSDGVVRHAKCSVEVVRKASDRGL